jgi:hypothetical protein
MQRDAEAQHQVVEQFHFFAFDPRQVRRRPYFALPVFRQPCGKLARTRRDVYAGSRNRAVSEARVRCPTSPKDGNREALPMAKTVMVLIEKRDEAQKAVDELLAAGFDRDQLGIITPEVRQEAAAAVTGASAGMVLGGLAGMLLAAAALMIPGVGPVLVAGPALTLMGGTTLGMLAGGLMGALTAKGMPEQDAHIFAEGLRRGHTLLSVNAKDEAQVRKASEIVKRHGAVDLDRAAAAWQTLGWSGRFDPLAPLAFSAATEARGATASSAGAGSSAASGAGAAPSSEAGSAAPSGDGAQRAEAMDNVPSSPARAASSAAPATTGCADTDLPAEVRVYEFVIEAADVPLPAARGHYSGPERRVSKAPYTGEDRRVAA